MLQEKVRISATSAAIHLLYSKKLCPVKLALQYVRSNTLELVLSLTALFFKKILSFQEYQSLNHENN